MAAAVLLLVMALSCRHGQPGGREAFLVFEGAALRDSRGASPDLELLRDASGLLGRAEPAQSIGIDYPFEGSIFPPEITAPEFLWRDQAARAQKWMVTVSFDSSSVRVYALANGKRPKAWIDSECIRPNNRWEEPPERANAHGWTPDSALWQLIKEQSSGRIAHITLYGIIASPDGKRSIVSRGSIILQTSKDPVGAPIFYRDVPLMPVPNTSGVIQPISENAIPLIAWRLRDIAKPFAPIVMNHMPTCINCHSFSSDGKTLGMDMDGPQGDKGAYALVPTAKKVVVQQADVFTWNKYNREKNTFGLFSRVSPDGKYVVSAVDEEVHVVNYIDFRFLQTFYPTKSRIAFYDRKTGAVAALPGASDSVYVQCNPVWSADGKRVAFLRAKARPAWPASNSPKAAFANDSLETPIKYDLYQVPFNGGMGGKAEPISGASNTGKSVSFPKYSPDGKWIVFVQAKNGLLMRPDSRLYIIPAEGGKARELACNLPLMNSWHSFSPNSKWLVFSSKAFTPFTQMFLTHIDETGSASPAILISNSTASNRAVNIPEFVDIGAEGISSIITPAVDYKLHLDKGKSYLKNGSIDSAYGEIMKSIALKPNYAENFSGLAMVLAKQGKMSEALDASLKAVAFDPANDQTHANAGIILYALHKIPEAVEQFKIAIKFNARNATTHFYYALTLEAGNNLKEALVEYDEALTYDTANADAYSNRGTILYGMKNVDKAIENFSTAIRLSHSKAEYFQNRAVAFAVKNNYEKALADLAQAAAINPDDGMTFNIRGNVYLQMDNTDKARMDFETALTSKLPCAKAIEPLCDICFSAHKHAEALPYLEQMITADPGNISLVNRRAVVYMYAGEAAKALEGFDRVLSQTPNDPTLHFNMALCREKLGDMAGAIKSYEEAVRYGSPQTEQFAFAKKRVVELRR
jgi:tetratricopeptide (TPR) repeat protein